MTEVTGMYSLQRCTYATDLLDLYAMELLISISDLTYRNI